jgi:hypothetical protein
VAIGCRVRSRGGALAQSKGGPAVVKTQSNGPRRVGEEPLRKFTSQEGSR